jgi:hypothetical protein
LQNSRSEDGGQGRASAAAAGGAKRRAFTDDGAKGTAREREKARLATTFNEKPRLKTIRRDEAF